MVDRYRSFPLKGPVADNRTYFSPEFDCADNGMTPLKMSMWVHKELSQFRNTFSGAMTKAFLLFNTAEHARDNCKLSKDNVVQCVRHWVKRFLSDAEWNRVATILLPKRILDFLHFMEQELDRDEDLHGWFRFPRKSGGWIFCTKDVIKHGSFQAARVARKKERRIASKTLEAQEKARLLIEQKQETERKRKEEEQQRLEKQQALFRAAKLKLYEVNKQVARLQARTPKVQKRNEILSETAKMKLQLQKMQARIAEKLAQNRTQQTPIMQLAAAAAVQRTQEEQQQPTPPVPPSRPPSTSVLRSHSPSLPTPSSPSRSSLSDVDSSPEVQEVEPEEIPNGDDANRDDMVEAVRLLPGYDEVKAWYVANVEELKASYDSKMEELNVENCRRLNLLITNESQRLKDEQEKVKEIEEEERILMEQLQRKRRAREQLASNIKKKMKEFSVFSNDTT